MGTPVREDLLRLEAPQVLAALVRRYGNFELAEEAVQDALLEAATSWGESPPDNPRGWLIRVAQRRLIDAIRSEMSRSDRESRWAQTEPESSEPDTLADHDDSLDLLFLCCHPALSAPSAVALTLRALGGLTTDEIAAAFFVPSATMGQRISRAKATIAQAGVTMDIDAAERAARVGSVLRVLYLMFSEGYTTSGGEQHTRVDLCAESIRLAHMLHASLPDHAEAAGLLALQLLHEARRAARDRDGIPVPIAEQNRSLWHDELIARGTALVDTAMATGPLGPFQVQAAITALHCAAPSADETDWVQILALYDLLTRVDPSPMARVSRAVAVAQVQGPAAGLDVLAAVEDSPELAGTHRIAAVRGHLLEQLGDHSGAVLAYREAARATRSLPEQRYLLARAAELEGG